MNATGHLYLEHAFHRKIYLAVIAAQMCVQNVVEKIYREVVLV
jgi:hypothetical protein